jgi:site-specific DNA recombinase
VLERPGLDRLRDDAHSGEFNLVLIHSPDRLARKAVYQGLVLEELEKAGVKVEFLNYPVDDSPEGKMLLGMQGLFAEYERTKIAERSRRGKLHKARQGVLMGGYVPCGYRYIRKDEGNDGKATLEIDGAQAAVVRDMYRWLVEEKLSCRRIAGRLNGLDIPTIRRGSHWTGGTVNRILKQEVYVGVFYYHRAEAVEPSFRRKSGSVYKHQATGRKLRPREEWVAITVPAIIDRETWEAARRQLQENFVYSPRHNIHYRYLLRGLVKCAWCGTTCSGTSHQGRRYYEHNRGNFPGATDIKCEMRSVRADPLEEVV